MHQFVSVSLTQETQHLEGFWGVAIRPTIASISADFSDIQRDVMRSDTSTLNAATFCQKSPVF